MKHFKLKDPGSAITHFIGMMMAMFAATPLILRAMRAPDTVHVISLSIFIVSMILLYAASTTYHTFDLSERTNKILKKLDHCMIFVLIAGSYTPICLIVLHGRTGFMLLALVWSIAILGIIFKLCWVTCPKWVSSVLYIAMGWVCVLAAFPFALGGFFQYNGMTLERFLLAYIRSEFLFPRRLVFKSDNIYAKALENSTIKEALKLD